MLEERGLIVRTSVMVVARNTVGGTLNTNVLHLKQFAPAVRLGPHQVFKVSCARGAGGGEPGPSWG